MLNRETILGAQDLKTIDVDVAEWGGTIRLRMLTAGERFAVNDSASVGGEFNPSRFQTALIESTAVNDNGTPMFQPGDAAALAGKSSSAIELVFSAAAKLNGLVAKSADAAEKN